MMGNVKATSNVEIYLFSLVNTSDASYGNAHAGISTYASYMRFLSVCQILRISPTAASYISTELDSSLLTGISTRQTGVYNFHQQEAPPTISVNTTSSMNNESTMPFGYETAFRYDMMYDII